LGTKSGTDIRNALIGYGNVQGGRYDRERKVIYHAKRGKKKKDYSKLKSYVSKEKRKSRRKRLTPQTIRRSVEQGTNLQGTKRHATISSKGRGNKGRHLREITGSTRVRLLEHERNLRRCQGGVGIGGGGWGEGVLPRDTRAAGNPPDEGRGGKVGGRGIPGGINEGGQGLGGFPGVYRAGG